MGRYSVDKDRYDKLTTEQFRIMGYISKTISGRLADVVGYNPKTEELAIVEVKSPRERDASVSCQTKFNINNLSRYEILELIKSHPKYDSEAGLMRVYAFTISSQLYNYFNQPDKHLTILNNKIKVELNKNNISEIRTYLSVPTRFNKILMNIINLFIEKRLLRSYHIYDSYFKKIFLIGIEYF